jgi:hypothetical protein
MLDASTIQFLIVIAGLLLAATIVILLPEPRS